MHNTAHNAPGTHTGAAVRTPASRYVAVLPWQETIRRKVSPNERKQRHGER
jgi:hypothetical protein